ncbi:hypothetical protein [Rathayibacter soli]|uniref:hypothetical protein n=1 Tax=Rathayibacter soli TaxID=3144168 RepID=UPI0027E515C6|nr:hypothetical protein [Glaciibacter superstes]
MLFAQHPARPTRCPRNEDDIHDAPGKPTAGKPTPGRRPRTRPVLSRTGTRLAFLIPGGIALLAGLDAALLLLGLPAPLTFARLPIVHGPLLVFGFIGTVIALERAVAIRKWWAFGSPAAFGLAGFLMLSPLPLAVGAGMLAVGSIALLFIYLAIWRRQAMLASAIQALGAFLGLASAVLWIGGLDASALVPGMAGFMILTIAGERVELARMVALSHATERAAFAVCVALALGVLAAMLWPAAGYPIFGAALIAVVIWLTVFDVATRLVKAKGLPRYIAACLLAGYFWLVVAGLIWLFNGPVTSGPLYDATVHSVFLGFTLAMIMAHAPVILPAVLRKPLPYRPIFYLPVVLLHLSLALRILAGDLRDLPVLVQWGGVLNIIAVLLFVILAIASVLRGVPKKQAAAAAAARRERISAAERQHPVAHADLPDEAP